MCLEDFVFAGLCETHHRGVQVHRLRVSERDASASPNTKTMHQIQWRIRERRQSVQVNLVQKHAAPKPRADREIPPQCNYTFNQVSWDNEDTAARIISEIGTRRCKRLTRKEQTAKQTVCDPFPGRFCPHWPAESGPLSTDAFLIWSIHPVVCLFGVFFVCV